MCVRLCPPTPTLPEGQTWKGSWGGRGRPQGWLRPTFCCRDRGLAASRCFFWCPMAVAPSRGETGTGPREEAKSRQAEGLWEKDEQSSLVMSKMQILQRDTVRAISGSRG